MDTIVIALLVITVLEAGRRLVLICTCPLSAVPRPWAARWTRLWELKQFHSGRFEQTLIGLHRQYGNISHPSHQTTNTGLSRPGGSFGSQ